MTINAQGVAAQLLGFVAPYSPAVWAQADVVVTRNWVYYYELMKTNSTLVMIVGIWGGLLIWMWHYLR